MPRKTKRITRKTRVSKKIKIPRRPSRYSSKKDKLETTLTLPSKTESVVVRKPKKSKKSKKKQSAYNKFFKKMNKQIKGENPTMKQAQIMKLVAQEWNAQK